MTATHLEQMLVVYNDRGQLVDGIRDHGERLVEELARTDGLRVGLQSRVAPPFVSRRAIDNGSLASLLELDDAAAVVVQYSPFCYGRWGFAPWLPARFVRLRTRRPRPTIALLVHEPYVPMHTARSVLMGLWQRAQLEALRLSADVVFCSIEPWALRLARRRPRRPVHHLPVGSNLPDGRAGREAERRRLGLGEGTVVLASFGTDHEAWMPSYVTRAANAVARDGRPVVLLSLGAKAPSIEGLHQSIRVFAPGYLGADALASKLAAADVFMGPVVDGVSTRRGTLMAALQHGLAVVGTLGPLTDPVLQEATSAMRLVPVDDPDLYAETVRRLAGSDAERRALGAAGRDLYESCFDWPVTSRRLLAALESSR